MAHPAACSKIQIQNYKQTNQDTAGHGEKEIWDDCASWSGAGKGYLEKPIAAPLGAAAQPLPWPFVPHVAGYE